MPLKSETDLLHCFFKLPGGDAAKQKVLTAQFDEVGHND